MDKLENLKDLWQNQQQTDIVYTKEDIYKMVQKKSTSIVKWILIHIKFSGVLICICVKILTSTNCARGP